MDDIFDDKVSLKKAVINSITYNINKKMNSYNEDLNVVSKKIDANNELNIKILDLLIKNNNDLSKKIINLENIINKISENSSNKSHLHKLEETKIEKKEKDKTSIKELKIEDFDIDNSFIKECIDMTNINGDILLFKKMYIDNVDKEYYPIRHIKKKLQYWKNNCMNDDNNGVYIKNIIIKNIEQCYFKINIYENYTDNIDQFIKNQEYLNQLTIQEKKAYLIAKVHLGTSFNLAKSNGFNEWLKKK
jgi:hypothetical protein